MDLNSEIAPDRHRRSDLLETVIGPSAAEAASNGLSDYRESLERVQKYLTRYKHVREQRAALEVSPNNPCHGPLALIRPTVREWLQQIAMPVMLDQKQLHQAMSPCKQAHLRFMQPCLASGGTADAQ